MTLDSGCARVLYPRLQTKLQRLYSNWKWAKSMNRENAFLDRSKRWNEVDILFNSAKENFYTQATLCLDSHLFYETMATMKMQDNKSINPYGLAWYMCFKICCKKVVISDLTVNKDYWIHSFWTTTYLVQEYNSKQCKSFLTCIFFSYHFHDSDLVNHDSKNFPSQCWHFLFNRNKVLGKNSVH